MADPASVYEAARAELLAHAGEGCTRSLLLVGESCTDDTVRDALDAAGLRLRTAAEALLAAGTVVHDDRHLAIERVWPTGESRSLARLAAAAADLSAVGWRKLGAAVQDRGLLPRLQWSVAEAERVLENDEVSGHGAEKQPYRELQKIVRDAQEAASPGESQGPEHTSARLLVSALALGNLIGRYAGVDQVLTRTYHDLYADMWPLTMPFGPPAHHGRSYSEIQDCNKALTAYGEKHRGSFSRVEEALLPYQEIRYEQRHGPRARDWILPLGRQVGDDILLRGRTYPLGSMDWVARIAYRSLTVRQLQRLIEDKIDDSAAIEAQADAERLVKSLVRSWMGFPFIHVVEAQKPVRSLRGLRATLQVSPTPLAQDIWVLRRGSAHFLLDPSVRAMLQTGLPLPEALQAVTASPVERAAWEKYREEYRAMFENVSLAAPESSEIYEEFLLRQLLTQLPGLVSGGWAVVE